MPVAGQKILVGVEVMPFGAFHGEEQEIKTGEANA